MQKLFGLVTQSSSPRTSANTGLVTNPNHCPLSDQGSEVWTLRNFANTVVAFQRVCGHFKIVDLNPYRKEALEYYVKR